MHYNSHTTPETALDASQFNFKIAFSAQNYNNPREEDYTSKSLFDWRVEFYEGDGFRTIGENSIVGIHKCEETDWQEFYDPYEIEAETIENFQENSSFWCMDKIDTSGKEIDWNLYGSLDSV